MLEKNVWKSDILSNNAAYIRTEYGEIQYLVRMQAASLLKMSLFLRCFSNILLVKTNYLVYP